MQRESEGIRIFCLSLSLSLSFLLFKVLMETVGTQEDCANQSRSKLRIGLNSSFGYIEPPIGILDFVAVGMQKGLCS